MKGMNEQVRQAVRERMKQQAITHEKLAELTSIQRPNVTRLLTGQSGAIPENWQKVLDTLGLELVAQPKREG
ncbi:helix-turn-helix transcriptional regulator [Deinococcus detaillensis]|uniref:Helix-turn-helix transcriptional regulator n=2 Tax=Deinococcus detaillensis TaxID=2592048 RepID=A0A553V5Z8_9DEIO|nr:helix-turn-helix transcriptional regulator [Deinococcus detaillensis]